MTDVLAAAPSRILATRDQLYAVLDAAGINTAAAAGQRLAPPGCAVDYGSPWVESMRLLNGATSRVRWSVVCYGAAIDADGAELVTAQLIERVYVALWHLYGGGGWSTPVIEAPRSRPNPSGGTELLASTLAMETLISLAPQAP